MVSTRQSSSVGGSGSDGNDTGGIKTRHTSAHHSQSHEIVPANASNSGKPPTQQDYVSNKHFLQLPPEIFDKIFSYTGYKAVSQMRLVCRQMDKICGSILNSTFQKLQNQMLHRFQNIKGKMPRRESARRNHPLACESDIIETLHMRLTLLQMSFGKHIERKHCCFFAGEILDEVYRILHYIKVTPKLARPYRVTDELFDLSTMAMEYFKEHIEPTLPEIAYFGTDFFDFSSGLQHKSNNKAWILESPPHNSAKVEYESPGPSEDRVSDQPTLQSQPQSNIVLRKRIRKIKQGMKKYNSQLLSLKRELRSCKSKMTDQQQQVHEYSARMDDYDKKNEETSRKFSTLLQELNKCKTEFQYWRSKSPLSSLCVNCKATTGVPTEEWQLFASQEAGSVLFDEPMPSTSSALDETPISWTTTAPNVAPKEAAAAAAVEEEEVKMRQVVATKRKSTCDDTPTTHTKKQKKPRCLKVRGKRS